MIHVYWPTNKNATWNQHNMALKHKTAYLKLLCLPLSSLPHIKNTTAKVWFIMSLLFSTSSCWWRFILYNNLHHSIRVNRCPHRTVYTHVVAKFIRSMSHSVTCSDLIGLLKSCSVFWAFDVEKCLASRQGVSRHTHFFLFEYCRFLKMLAVLAARCSKWKNFDDDWWAFTC